jgi:hypothetical protein
MALCLLENRDFLGFRMIFRVWLNQIFSNFNTMLTNTPQQTGDEIMCFKIKYDKLEKVDLVITDTPAFQILNEAMKGMKHANLFKL